MAISHTSATSLLPIRVAKTDGNVVLNTVTTWTDVDTTGTAAARTYDVVIPGVATDQWVSAKIDCFSSADIDATALDVWTIVAGTPIRRFFGTLANEFSAPGWMFSGDADYPSTISAEHFTQLQATDIENGSVRLRIRYYQFAGSRSIVSGSGGALVFEGRGPLG